MYQTFSLGLNATLRVWQCSLCWKGPHQNPPPSVFCRPDSLLGLILSNLSDGLTVQKTLNDFPVICLCPDHIYSRFTPEITRRFKVLAGDMCSRRLVSYQGKDLRNYGKENC